MGWPQTSGAERAIMSLLLTMPFTEDDADCPLRIYTAEFVDCIGWLVACSFFIFFLFIKKKKRMLWGARYISLSVYIEAVSRRSLSFSPSLSLRLPMSAVCCFLFPLVARIKLDSRANYRTEGMLMMCVYRMTNVGRFDGKAKGR